jgi:hypothetical protein
MRTRRLCPAREAGKVLARIGTLLGWLRRRIRDVFVLHRSTLARRGAQTAQAV